MRAVVVEQYGPPERAVVTGLPMPSPSRGEVLVRVEAAGVSAGDARIRAGRFPDGMAALGRLAIGLRGPRTKVLGVTLSGVVEQLGTQVTGLAVGDEVAGMSGARMGTHASHATVPAARLVRKPADVSHPAAAGVLFGGTTALWFLRDKAHLEPGQTVLVNGASGAVGTSAVQIAKHLGAYVTAVTSARNRALVTGLGADVAVDYAATPVATLSERFDVVVDAVGTISRAQGLELTRPTGSFAMVVAGLRDMISLDGRVLRGSAPERREDARLLLDLVASGELDPVTEVVGGLDSVVEAYRRIDGGHKVGNLVICPQQTATP